MSSLASIEKMKFEKLLEMECGSVLDFSNASFKRLIYENSGIDIYDERYADDGDSKAKLLRCFWNKESNQIVAKVLSLLLEYFDFKGFISEINTQNLYTECCVIIERLNSVKDEMLELNSIGDEDFETLSWAIEEAIKKGQPVLALDRLHTYMVKYVRRLCDRHNLNYTNNEPLNSCFGKYIKKIDSEKLVEGEMSKIILKFGISIFDKFNYIRNNKSYAHDNEVLNNDESMFIYRSIVNMVYFIDSIENKSEL